MASSFTISDKLHSSPKFLRCGLLARYLFKAMINKADDEGRALADPLHWQQEAALWGAAAVDLDEIAGAVHELASQGLVVLYDDGARLFMPGRFEHNPGRTYWTKSKHPLPPQDLLAAHPEYLEGLAGLCVDGRIRDLEDSSKDRRYPGVLTSPEAMDREITDDHGDSQEIASSRKSSQDLANPPKESPIGVGVGVGDKKEGEARAGARARGPRPQVKSGPTSGEMELLEVMAHERGRDLATEAKAADLPWPLRGSPDVTALKRHFHQLDKLSDEEQLIQARRAVLDQLWEDLRLYLRNPDSMAHGIRKVAERDDRHGWALLCRLSKWINDEAEASGWGRPVSLMWGDLDKLPDIYRRYVQGPVLVHDAAEGGGCYAAAN